MNQSPAASPRDLKIDILKGLLVADMLWSHVMGYLGLRENRLVDGTWNIFVLITFSGFVFCMGYVIQVSYLQFDSPPVGKLLRSTGRTMIGYYIAVFSFFIIFRNEFDRDLFFSILSLLRFGSISEFLLAFALIPLAVIVLTRPIKKLMRASDRLFFSVIFLLLLTTFLPTHWVKSTYIGLFIGGPQGSIYYPLLQYFSFFLLGARYAARNITVGTGHLLAGILALAIFVAAWNAGLTFSRFPPSLGWIVFGAAGFFVWYWVADRLARWPLAANILAPVGANSLFFFVVSDILIFGISPALKGRLGILGGTLLAVLLLAIIHAMMSMVRPRGR
ncbi:MAG: hypothetical protein HFACDABA_02648 [Anaerolineales bacterium]|nr:hypothetical protein [Anaerolineales bacterium]